MNRLVSLPARAHRPAPFQQMPQNRAALAAGRAGYQDRFVFVA